MRLDCRIERWPVRGAFTIARGAKTHVDVVVAEIVDGPHRGRGEGTAIYYHGESAESVAAAVAGERVFIEGGGGREGLRERMAPGAARNALDCALWDLDAKRAGVPAWRSAGLGEPRSCATAYTVSLDEPARMDAAARAAMNSGYRLLKLKLAGEGDIERVAAVRRGAPQARMIVDANEAWTGRDVAAAAVALADFGVELIEQPVKAGEDARLDGVRAALPLCADESCQSLADLDRCLGRYQAVNIKLDKAGGLTEALALAAAARAAGLGVMVGCMLATSLGIAPARLLAADADWVDLDGALLLAEDRADGMRVERGYLEAPAAALWG